VKAKRHGRQPIGELSAEGLVRVPVKNAVGDREITDRRNGAPCMGTVSRAQCRICSHAFELNEGGGYYFDLQRCDACGAAQAVPVEPRGDYDIARLVPASLNKPIRWKTRKRCACGGRFAPNAPPRCPACRSADVLVGRVIAYYD
jgi:hypothetical protein